MHAQTTAAASAPAAKRGMNLEDLAKFERVGDPQVSPDGAWIAYTVSKVDVGEDKGLSQLWMVSWDGKQDVQLTFSKDGAGGPQWSPDGRWLAFTSGREGSGPDAGKGSQVWVLNRRGGEAQQLTNVKENLDGFKWSPDSKTLLLTLTTVAAAALLAVLAMWWRQPFDNVDGRISPVGFDVEGFVVPAYAFFSLAVGVLAGALLRRTIPAMSLAAAAFFAVRLGVEKFLRPHYLAPLHRTANGLTQGARARDWVLENRLVDAVGRQISAAREDLAILHAQHARVDPQDYLLSLGWKRVITFQPDGRFWTFQAIEMGVFVLLGLLAVAASLALVRRAPA